MFRYRAQAPPSEVSHLAKEQSEKYESWTHPGQSGFQTRAFAETLRRPSRRKLRSLRGPCRLRKRLQFLEAQSGGPDKDCRDLPQWFLKTNRPQLNPASAFHAECPTELDEDHGMFSQRICDD